MHDCDKLAQVASTISETSVDTVVNFISSSGKANETQNKILAYFRSQVRNIIRTILDDTGDDSALWMIVEECYCQSIERNGALRSDPYYSQKKASNTRSEAWAGFWIKALHACPDGPTLFYPPATMVAIEKDGLCYPPKLIGTSDMISLGLNNKYAMVSVMSQAQHVESRIDILRLPMATSIGSLSLKLLLQTILSHRPALCSFPRGVWVRGTCTRYAGALATYQIKRSGWGRVRLFADS